MIGVLAGILAGAAVGAADAPPAGDVLRLELGAAGHPAVEVVRGDARLVASPEEGLWSVATGWKDGWPSDWHHASPDETRSEGGWTILSGHLDLPGGTLRLRDAYRLVDDTVEGLRRYEWTGQTSLEPVTLAIRWEVPGRPATPYLPGISIAGNPSGAASMAAGRGCVPVQTGAPGERSYYEEHRFAMPFVLLDLESLGARRAISLHSMPSPIPGGHRPDQWWSLGLTSLATGSDAGTELALLSGPCASKGRVSVVKARQGEFLDYPDTWMVLRPGAIVEKRFVLDAATIPGSGAALARPITTALRLHQPFALDGLPTEASILESKWRFARSRWRDRGQDPGFEMYPDFVACTDYVMGWCGQAEALGYALLVLDRRLGDPQAVSMATRSLDLLATAPFNANGFLLRYAAEKGTWSEQDFVSQGQALESITRAIEVARRRGIDCSRWEAFAKKACALHAERLLAPGWRPVSTNEAFLVSPLLRGARLFGDERTRKAALAAAEHYAGRHIAPRGSPKEPYWGGTLDAQCEDKEGAWAAFQAFLAAFDDTGDRRWLERAEDAMWTTLSFTVVWDIGLPPGRLADHGFTSRGWTVVSAQNQHLDVFGVFFAPEVYRMGQLLGRPELEALARVMVRSCGQLIDPAGSQGEQIQQTNFAQQGDMSDVSRMRGGYSEGWTVFWITTHFLHALARFEEMGVDLDQPGAAGGVR